MSEVLFIFGEGGHCAQMKRLAAQLSLVNTEIVALVDKKNISTFFTKKEYVTKALRNKHNNTVLSYFSNFYFNLKLIFKLLTKHKFSAVLSTGPGICLIPSLMFRLFGKEVIFIETWSRFNTKSFTGKCMYYIATHFYVQNKSLLMLYPKAIYSGRL
jgi:beta-1,4-N-acetylglucosaminyltransferase